MKIPQEYVCPITLLPMNDPVIASDGHSYEREAIVQWLKTNPNSPLTRQPMNVNTLQPNPSLKAAIEAWNKKGKEKKKSQSEVKKNPLQEKQNVQADHYVALQIYERDLQTYQQSLPAVQVSRPVVSSQPRLTEEELLQRKRKVAAMFMILVVVIFFIWILKDMN